MEIKEENLFTEEETQFIEKLMKTSISHQEEILKNKKEHIRNMMSEDPFIQKLKDFGGADMIENAIDSVLKNQHQKMLDDLRQMNKLAASILIKLADRQHTKK